jgi:hypothetical protein
MLNRFVIEYSERRINHLHYSYSKEKNIIERIEWNLTDDCTVIVRFFRWCLDSDSDDDEDIDRHRCLDFIRQWQLLIAGCIIYTTCVGVVLGVFNRVKCFRHVFIFDKLGKIEQIKQQVDWLFSSLDVLQVFFSSLSDNDDVSVSESTQRFSRRFRILLNRDERLILLEENFCLLMIREWPIDLTIYSIYWQF